MKLAIMIPSLNTGGAERTAVSLANWLARNKNIDVYLINPGKDDNNYIIDEKVNYFYNVNKISRIKFYFKTISFLKEKKIDIIFEMLFTPLRSALIYKFLFNHNCIIIGSERANPAKYSNYKGFIRSHICPYLCDNYIFQTQIVKNMFSPKIQLKSVVIPNAISNPEVYNIKKDKEKKEKVIVSVGRLTEQKGFDVLIKAFSKIVKKHSDYKLEIYGNGPLKEKLKNLIEEMSLEQYVSLKGNSSNIIEKIYDKDIFVLCSRYEGMPNALMEAMAIGLPCISTDCIAGPSELIKNLYNGILVPVDDIDSIEKSLNLLIENQKLKNELGSNAKKIMESHDIDFIYNQFYKYFELLYERKGEKHEGFGK